MLKLAKPRTNAMKQSCSYHAAKTWNKMPTELKNLMISDIEYSNTTYKISLMKTTHS